MHRLLEKLHKDHTNLEQVLSLLSVQLDHFYAGRESNFDLKIELMEYLEAYADQGHHPLENRIFSIAMKRSDTHSELLQRLQSQHEGLGQLTRKFRHSLENILQGGVMTREELEVQGREYIALQRQHLDLEESEAFPAIDGLMTDEDWRQVEEGMPSYDDPVFDAPDKIRFHNLFEYLSSSEEAGEE
ncbi:MAG: hemerythrin domain-containing protein [Candidatus Sedimenticola sp. 20ELBAFRAG]